MKVNEKMDLYGATCLTDEELLNLLNLDGDSETIETLIHCESLREVESKLSVTRRTAEKLFSVLEIAKRIAKAAPKRKYHIGSPQDAADYLMPRLRNENVEHFVVILLNTKNRVIKDIDVSKGSLNSSVVHAREVFKQAIVYNAAAVVVAHNHPSGNPNPSKEDREVTRMLAESGKIMGIPLLDHIVIGDGKYYSFQENGEL